MKTKKIFELTVKEAIEIAELLETLEGMGGAPDEEFTKEASRAGKIAKKIRQLIRDQKEILCIRDKTKVCNSCHECDVSVLNPSY